MLHVAVLYLYHRTLVARQTFWVKVQSGRGRFAPMRAKTESAEGKSLMGRAAAGIGTSGERAVGVSQGL